MVIYRERRRLAVEGGHADGLLSFNSFLSYPQKMRVSRQRADWLCLRRGHAGRREAALAGGLVSEAGRVEVGCRGIGGGWLCLKALPGW